MFIEIKKQNNFFDQNENENPDSNTNGFACPDNIYSIRDIISMSKLDISSKIF